MSDHGKKPVDREIAEHLKYGIILLDKVSGPTSHQVDVWIKEIINNAKIPEVWLNKVSHGGTLDPRTTGVLIIALENSTKLMPILLSSKKEYVALMCLHDDVPKKDIEKICKEFVGKIKQLPPLKSAVARRVRERMVYSLGILEIDDRNVLMRVRCEAGTYIRRLCDDIGKKLGCGAHMLELRRIKSGQFGEENLVTLQTLSDAISELKKGNEKPIRKIVLPLEIIGEKMKKVIVKDSAIEAVCNGAPLARQGITKFGKNIQEGDLVAIFSQKGEMVGFGNALMGSGQIEKKRHGLVIKTDRVIMKKGTYPKGWK